MAGDAFFSPFSYSSGWFLTPRGVKLATHCWRPSSDASALRVLVIHGLGSHGAFPTVRLLAEHLVDTLACSVYSFDQEGSGDSDGLPGLIVDTDNSVADARAYIEQELAGTAPLFVLGSSLGGGLALRLACQSPTLFQGLVLFSPMVVIAEAARPPAWAIGALRLLCALAPFLALLGGSSGDGAAQYADEEIRAACESDPKRYTGKLRLGTASALLSLSEQLEGQLGSVIVPFLALHGTADTVVDVTSSRRLVAHSRSQDKRLVEFEGARHTLLAELPPRRAEVLLHVTEWLRERA